MLSEASIKDFKEIYKEEYGADISDDEALELATNLINFVNKIYRPVLKHWVTKD